METRVRELRQHRKISQTTLSVYVGCSQNTISKIEKGTCDPKASILIEMSKYFGVSWITYWGLVILNILGGKCRIRGIITYKMIAIPYTKVV